MASIKCAHCKQTHSSVAEVRNCAGQPLATVGSWAKPDASAGNPRAGLVGISRAATALADERADEGAAQSFLGATVVKSAPGTKSPTKWVREMKSAAALVPAGRYALWTGNKDADGREIYHFFKVDKPEHGKWAGYTFVKGINPGAGDEWRLQGDKSLEVLQKIGQDAEQSSADYGHATNTCGVCSRELSNPESVERGIGPVCWANTF